MNDEHRRSIDDCYDEIKSIKKWIDNNPLHSNIRYLVSYSVVKSSGTIGIVFKSMIHCFLSKGCIPETTRFLEKNILDSSCNPNTRNIAFF